MNVNFIHADLPDSDRKLFFDVEEAESFQDNDTLAEIVVRLGKFPSITQAKKNGWNKPIPEGFKQHKIGKTFFWTLNKF